MVSRLVTIFLFLQRKHVNEKGETLLHEAAIAGNSQRVKELLAKVSQNYAQTCLTKCIKSH